MVLLMIIRPTPNPQSVLSTHILLDMVTTGPVSPKGRSTTRPVSPKGRATTRPVSPKGHATWLVSQLTMLVVMLVTNNISRQGGSTADIRQKYGMACRPTHDVNTCGA